MKRRQFLAATGTVAASSCIFPNIIRAENLGGQKLRLAMIGVGGRGAAHIKGMASEQFVAFCDVDEKRAANMYQKYPEIPRFKDFRVMFDKMSDQFDAVSIAVPDHMHYPIALWAMAHGKHVLCEKPLVRTFEEAMLLKDAARSSGVITQMGNQGHAGEGVRQIEEWIRAGLIGEVREAFHWTNRPIWPQGISQWPEKEVVPNTLDWNLWLGVAPERDFSSQIAPRNWRGYWNYGCGAIGDIACHAMDASYTPLKLGFPTHITAKSTGSNGISFPKASTIIFEFPRQRSRRPFKVTWMDGGRRPKDVPFVPNEFIQANPEKNRKGIENGSIIVGTEAAIFTDMYAGQVRIFPVPYFRELNEDSAFPEPSLERVKGSHFMEWVNCIKEGRQPGSNIADYAADFTGTALLGTVALALNDRLEFDAESLRFTNNQQANRLLRSQYSYRKEFIAS